MLLFCFSCTNSRQSFTGPSFILHSEHIGDDYLIRIRLPEKFDPDQPAHMIFVADGTIGTGQYILGTDTAWKAALPEGCIAVTIGHQGNWKKKRRRDFIPSDISGYADKDFGRADLFYLFLKSELMPAIAKKYPLQKSRTFIGHSFSGLFCLYAALKNEQLFDQYVAISPSVWANDAELIKMEEQLAQTNTDLKARIHLFAGGLEVFNKVLSSTRRFHNQLAARKYPGLELTFSVIGGSNHYSVRKPAIDRTLKTFSR